jgi:hypothetical protein
MSNGDKAYKMPLIGKERLLRSGTLPVRILASANACLVAREVMGDLPGW